MNAPRFESCVVIFALTVCGCQQAQPAGRYRTAFPTCSRRPDEAKLANEQGLNLVAESNYEQAEEAFRAALAADLSYAPAHNNLGLVLLAKGKLYEAALEFSFAANLDKRAPEPLVNLGRLYETVGWHEAAVAEYEKALNVDQNNVEAVGRLAYAYTRAGREPHIVRPLLHALAGVEGEGEWNRWALTQLGDESDPTPE